MQDGVRGVEDGREHGGELGPAHALVPAQVEDAEEEAALVGEGAVQHHRQTTHKLLKADLSVLWAGQWREGAGQWSEGGWGSGERGGGAPTECHSTVESTVYK